MSCPAKTVVNVPGTRSCSRAKATAGRALRAAQPQIELTTTNVAPGASRSVASTSSAVRSSRTPSRVSSSRIGVTNRSSYGMIVSCREVMPRRLQIVVAAAVADQREDGCLRHDEITIAFERDLDACLTEEQRVVADARLHWHESRLASRRAPWLVAQLAGIRHRKAGASGRNAPALHRLTIHCRRRQIQPHLAAFFALFECDEHAIADHDEGLRAAGFWCHGSGARGSGASSRVRFQRYKGGHGRTGPDRSGAPQTYARAVQVSSFRNRTVRQCPAVSALSLATFLFDERTPHELHDEREHEREHDDRDTAPDERRERHRQPVRPLGAGLSDALDAHVDERRARQCFGDALDHREKWGTPHPLMNGMVAEVGRRHA